MPSLSNLQTVGESLSFSGLPISNLPSLDNLTSAGLSLSIFAMPQITQINLPSLITLGGSINIQNNAALTTINAPLLQTTVQVLLASNPSMTEINGFPSLTTITERLAIAFSNTITAVNAFANLETIGFLFLANTNLTNVDFLSNVSGMTAGFQIFGNPNLVNLNGLNNIEIIEGVTTIFGKTIDVRSNQALTSLGAIDLTSNTHFTSVLIRTNFVLADVSALSGISGEIDTIDLNGFTATNLNFLSNVNKVSTTLSITSIPGLNDISGIANIDVADLQNLVISNNTSLDNCAVTAVCNALNLSTSGTPLIDISVNNTNCADNGTVAAACQALSIEEFNSFSFSVYPNPFTDSINIQIPSGITKASVKIMNIEGKVVHTAQLTRNQDSINELQTLAKGLYLMQLTLDNGEVATYKLVK
jgi:hypothetical protein